MKPRNVSHSQPLATILRQDVLTALQQTGYSQHRTLEIRSGHGSDYGTVIVEGFLPTYHLRQVAMECIRRVPGVSEVVDEIRVAREAQDD